MAAEEGDIITFIFTGEEGEVIPQNATHFIAHESLKVIPARLFYQHPNISELICHAGVKKIERAAFFICPRLRRVIIPGVNDIEGWAFYNCQVLMYVECLKLERIGGDTFSNCTSLSSINLPSAKDIINLPSAKVVEGDAFYNCDALTDVKFGKQLESIGRRVFHNCRSLERITIPLKNGLFTDDNVFQLCGSLKSVDLVEEAVLREIIVALSLEEWRNDMSAEIDSINQILPNAPGGDSFYPGGVRAIQEWISRVLRKIIHYKAEHRRLLTEASTSLMHALPNEIVMNCVLPFLALPSHTFHGKDHEGEVGDYSQSNNDTDDDESHDTSDGGDDDNDDDGDEDNSNNYDELHNASFGGGDNEQERGDEVQRKRRKTANDDE